MSMICYLEEKGLSMNTNYDDMRKLTLAFLGKLGVIDVELKTISHNLSLLNSGVVAKILDVKYGYHLPVTSAQSYWLKYTPKVDK